MTFMSNHVHHSIKTVRKKKEYLQNPLRVMGINSTGGYNSNQNHLPKLTPPDTVLTVLLYKLSRSLQEIHQVGTAMTPAV